MAQLTIYKASAGSGKTYRLVLEYLKLLVDNPYNYRHILAVTFTNKATAEMKLRVLRDLNRVAHQLDEQLMQKVIEETGKDPVEITKNAKTALSLILHNYDRFAINTIDSFFQKVLRSFARESGLLGTYEVELDQNKVMDEAVDRLLLSVEKDQSLRNWLLSMAETQMMEGGSWQIREKILDLGAQLHNEEFQKHLADFSDEGSSHARLKSLQAKIYKQTSGFEKQLKQLAGEALQQIADAGLHLTDFKGGSRSFVNHFKYWHDLQVKNLLPSNTVLGALNVEENWYTKTSKKQALIAECFHNGLNEKLAAILNFLEKNRRQYLTALEIKKYIYALGVLSALSAKVREIGRESNTLLLSEGNQILNEIIAHNDAPFIYEKTGSFYHHFMIDEFQDTSITQWQNFKPLLTNSLAEGFPNLVVGDVKQSIYRWRNSDWQLLDRQIKNELGSVVTREVPLEDNWRSAKPVVDFNNGFFKWSSTVLQDEFNAEILGESDGDAAKTIVHAFSDTVQFSKSDLDEGIIEIAYLEDQADVYEKSTIEQLIGKIKEIQKKGFKAKDIAVLVRKNRQGKKIASALLKEKERGEDFNFEVISDDTLFIDSSAAVRFLAGLIHHVTSPSDKVVQAAVLYEYAQNLLPELEARQISPERIADAGQQELVFGEEDEGDTSIFSEKVQLDYFPFFSAENKTLRNQWNTLAIGSLVEELIAVYQLDKLDGEQANLQAFRDLVADFSRRESSNLNKFIEWWKAHGSNVKVQTTGERDAIRIMTIHKSKGLEFPFVLVPFCDWKFLPDAGKNILWCKTGGMEYDEFPVLPIAYHQGLANTAFNAEFQNESMLSYIDNLNLLYVAFTRAISGLFIFTKDLKKYKSAADGLLHHYKQKGIFKELQDAGEQESSIRIGDFGAAKSESSMENEVALKASYRKNKNIRSSLRIRCESENFLEEGKSPQEIYLNEGKLMHELLSEIVTEDDIPAALEKMVLEGKVNAGEKETYLAKLQKLLRNEQGAEWFDGSFKVLNERTIVMPVFQLLRPDRVMIRGDEAVVVDYKTTSKRQSMHQTQVNNYVDKIKAMGYSKVSGYVWYLNSNEIVSTL